MHQLVEKNGAYRRVGPFNSNLPSEYEEMSKTKSVERSEVPLAKTILAKLIQIGEPTRSTYAERLRELKPKALLALQLLSEREGKREELALTQPLSERERENPNQTGSDSEESTGTVGTSRRRSAGRSFSATPATPTCGSGQSLAVAEPGFQLRVSFVISIGITADARVDSSKR